MLLSCDYLLAAKKEDVRLVLVRKSVNTAGAVFRLVCAGGLLIEAAVSAAARVTRMPEVHQLGSQGELGWL